MITQKKSIDFQKMINDVKNYFTHLPRNMIIAWSVLGLGIILIIVGIFLL